ncbi:MAG TPA: carboxylesterase family protein [Gemmatimonadaceae bacterium]
MRTRLSIALLALSPFATALAQATNGAPRVQTANGTLEGTTLPSGVKAFRGVPFADAPVGANRWRPPQPVKNWTGVRKADQFANQCMQARVFGDMNFRNPGMSEDCLYLNVWVPPTAKAGQNLPVLVYYYGGGFIAGDGSEPRYDGESMAKRGIIVVTTSYRLGIFGFFSHPELTAESPNHASGNYTLMDGAAALKWVQANISRFGGNPKHVTIAGESAGSFAVSAQMASPMARDLIAGAIGESGAFFSTTIATPTRDSTEKLGVVFAQTVGAPNLAALRAIPDTALLRMSSRQGQGIPRFGPNVDGYFFPDVPAKIFAAGQQAKVPLLAGWNSEEMNSRAILPETPNSENVKALLTKMFPRNTDAAAKVFPASTPEEAQQSATDLASDRFIGFSTWKWLDVHAKTSGKPVYRYLYARPRPATVEAGVTPNLAGGVTRGGNAPAAPAAKGAVHSAEIEYAMGNLGTNKVFKWSDEDYKVSQTMQGYFANFIKTFNPNGAGLPKWPVGNPDASGNVQRIRIDVDTRAEAEPRARYLLQDEVYSAER